VAFLVPLADEEPRAVRINISVPEEALLEIDEYAERHGMSRSGFLVSAARERIRSILTEADRSAPKKESILARRKPSGRTAPTRPVLPGSAATARKRPRKSS
jgi:uncharacterized protein (DUF1778 family)